MHIKLAIYTQRYYKEYIVCYNIKRWRINALYTHNTCYRHIALKICYIDVALWYIFKPFIFMSCYIIRGIFTKLLFAWVIIN